MERNAQLNSIIQTFLALKAMCEYIRRDQASDFKLLSDAKCILGRTVRVKEVDKFQKSIHTHAQ